MSYTHIRNDRGVIHAVPDDGGEWTVCGKETPHNYDEVTDPVSCKVCQRSIDLSRSHRIARKLTSLTKTLYEDMQSRPGAYIHADKHSILLMMSVVEGE